MPLSKVWAGSLVLLAAVSLPLQAASPVKVGSKIDTEGALLGNIILQVTDKKAVKDKYKVAVIKRAVEFSKETYNKAYNEFSQFIAANPTVDKVAANAEESGYKLLERNDLYSSEHGIGGIRGTKEALKWAFAAKPGEVSGLYECGESDRMLVVGLVSVIEEGYLSLIHI